MSAQQLDRTWPAIFADRVAEAPDAVAVVVEDVSLTYAQLDAAANRLAHLLIGLGAGPERIVALALPRTVEMVIGHVAVLASGAAYLPLDTDHPADRLAFMLEDADPVAVVTVAGLATEIPDTGAPRLVLDDPATVAVLAAAPTTRPTDVERGGPIRVDNAAYVIYTSGSTGRPKGVVLSHRGVGQLIATQVERFGIGPDDRILQFASPSFDVAFWDLCLGLLSGGRLIVVPAHRRVPGPELTEYAAEHGATFMILPPALLAVLPPDCHLPPGATLLAGTERVSPELIARYGRDRRMFNAYGPTEATVNSTLGESHPDRISGPVVPIGVPDPGTTAHILDDQLLPVAPGEPGELYLGGAGLARGYLHRPDLTAGRFVADPFGNPGERLYRTGDLVRTNADGALEFLGRTDDQIKIRGYRIEPGEIESVLLGHEAVETAAVLAREVPGVGGRRLVAYVVPAGDDHRDALLTGLRSYAADHLPDYMVPAAFVALDRLPVLPSGKLDRAALPLPDFAAVAGDRAPATAAELILCDVVAEVLRLPQVGADDDFFALGGDSIVAIALVIRARASGLQFTPRTVFEQRTVAALARAATPVAEAPPVDPDAGVGTFRLTPIMRWLDDCAELGADVDAFSQTMVVATPAGLTRDRLTVALQTLLDRHDVLRARIVRSGPDGEGYFVVPPRGSVDAARLLTVRQVEGVSAAGVDILAAAEGAEAARRLDPAAGTVLAATWFDAGPQAPGRLLLAAAHWVMDGVSWRILLPELAAAAGTGPASPPDPTTPFGRWSELLDADAVRPGRVAELQDWTAILDGPDPRLGARPLDRLADLDTVTRLTLTLPPSVTDPLLSSVPAAFHGGVNDVLLTGFALAVAAWRAERGTADASDVLIALEGHGREEQVGEAAGHPIDLSRTAGWFTTVFPVRLDPGDVDRADALAGGPAAGTAVKRIKEQLRAIPDAGIGYGLLRYLNPATGAVLATYDPPQISFNYLGRFAVADHREPWATVAGAGMLAGGADEAMPVVPYALEVNAFTADTAAGPELGVSWTFPTALFDPSDVRALAEGWFAALRGLVRHAAGPGAGGHTPSDLSLVSLSQEEIEEFEAEWQL